MSVGMCDCVDEGVGERVHVCGHKCVGGCVDECVGDCVHVCGHECVGDSVDEGEFDPLRCHGMTL